MSRGPPGSATDVPAPNKDEGAREKREKPSAPWQQEDQLCRRAQRPSNPRWAFPPGSFLSMVTLTVSLAAHPALQLVLLGVNSGAGSEAGFAVFSSGRNGLYLKLVPPSHVSQHKHTHCSPSSA